MRKFFLVTSLSILLFACKTQNLLESKSKKSAAEQKQDAKDFAYNPKYEYKIRVDDKISISVWGEDEFSVGSLYGIYNSNEVYGKWLMVDHNGNIELPKLGTTNVLGKTIPVLKTEIKDKLKKFLVNPIVDVKVLNKEITILGEVRNPNVVQIDKDHVNLLEMISKTGGFEFYANLTKIKILRQEGENVKITNIDLTKDGDILNKNIQLLPGDIVIVPSKKFKEFDKRISTIVPFTTTVTAAAVILGFFK
ncbi:polysaccharide biosynthesis/export family protein [Flavobacterium branchiophilum]|uniref:Probable polysaccharide exporter lipoprotein n=1 Tax=Flavobacterium branchiophilum (strain FL-15) TaxID=1034807 RepID=G2Z2V0_FLABF|nr:polysaccharide biosynthesis/export family protein [Flavobacterium branchiophilum]CCB70279.1 Probable polysaccharide exporter lipoprotein precursor [Flavobacterium branchiophilum FL-15]